MVKNMWCQWLKHILKVVTRLNLRLKHYIFDIQERTQVAVSFIWKDSTTFFCSLLYHLMVIVAQALDS